MKMIALMLLMVAASMSAVMVILTITNIEYLIVVSNVYIPLLIIYGFTTAFGIATYVFVKGWNKMFLR